MKKLLVLGLMACAPAFAGFYGSVMGGVDVTDQPHPEFEADAGCGVGGAIGYQWCAGWRVEAESTYRWHDQRLARSGAFFDGVDSEDFDLAGDFSAATVMANFGGSLPKLGCIQPYVLAGVGGAYVEQSLVIGSNEDWMQFKDERWVFAYQWIGGVETSVARCTKVGVQYRMLNIDHGARQVHGFELVLRQLF